MQLSLGLFSLVFMWHYALGAAVPAKAQVARRTLPRNWTFDGTNHYNVALSGGRSARLHITRTYDDSVPHPVIFAFHGANADAGNMEAISGLSSDTLKVAGVDPILVYGQGIVGTNGKSWQGAPYSSSADDLAYVRELLAAVKSNMNVDSSRIYATGFSNGAGFVNLLACVPDTAATFAAFSAGSAALYPGTRGGSGCNSNGTSISFLEFHGQNDGNAPYNGRTNRDGDVAYAEPSIDSWRQGWAQRVGCAAPPAGAQLATTTTESPFVASGTSRYTWKCPQGDVVGYTIQSMGHYWLSSNDVISATQISLEFFGNHTLVSS